MYMSACTKMYKISFVSVSFLLLCGCLELIAFYFTSGFEHRLSELILCAAYLKTAKWHKCIKNCLHELRLVYENWAVSESSNEVSEQCHSWTTHFHLMTATPSRSLRSIWRE